MSDYRKLSAFFKVYQSRVYANTKEAMRKAGHAIEASAKRNLLSNGNIVTGNLYDSIRFDGLEYKGRSVIARVYADAKTDDGTEYAEFIEFGTGIYNQHGDGRKTPWRYQDQDGNWHRTRGSRPHPFMRPAFAEHLGELRSDMRKSIRVDGKGIL